VTTEDSDLKPVVEPEILVLEHRAAAEGRVSLRGGGRRKKDHSMLTIGPVAGVWQNICRLRRACHVLAAAQIHQPVLAVAVVQTPGCRLQVDHRRGSLKERLAHVKTDQQNNRDWQREHHRPDGVDRNLRRPENLLIASPLLLCHG
jgi:hypothetical protein